jgi:hypothetical protein
MHIPTRNNRGGRCFRASCRAPGATWFNKSSRAYYCQSCARKINDANPDARSLYGAPLCEEVAP